MLNETPEPVAAILAEMRRDNRPYGISPDRLRSYADRIEAAAKHLRDATKMAGNTAAMREALEWAAQFVELGVDDDLGADGQNLTTAAEMARAALAAPPRNCDLLDANGAWKGFLARGNNAEISASYQIGANAAIRWLYAAAEGGAEVRT